MTVLGLIGTAASILGNETAIRWGRRKLISLVMAASILIGGSIGFIGATSYPVAVALPFFYAFIVWMDSSSPTAGAAGTAEPSRRSATLAVHSMLGYAGGFIGPLMIGFILDLAGDRGEQLWMLCESS